MLHDDPASFRHHAYHASWRKKIKEDTGRWREIEMYIMEHSQASFTHGMCPECFKRVKKQLDDFGETGSGRDSIVLG